MRGIVDTTQTERDVVDAIAETIGMARTFYVTGVERWPEHERDYDRAVAERIVGVHIAPLVQERDEARKDASQWEETAEALQTERDELERERDKIWSDCLHNAGRVVEEQTKRDELERQVAGLREILAEIEASNAVYHRSHVRERLAALEPRSTAQEET